VGWVPTRGHLRFASGAEAFVYSGAAGDQLRGPQHHFAWCDEIAKWRQADLAWDNLMMGMRLGPRPRIVVTTTPRSVAIVRRLKMLGGTVVTGGATGENVHVTEEFRRWVVETYGGTRLGRQEIEGKLFEEVEGALFPRELLERARVALSPALAPGGRELFVRVVVGVDPPVSADGDACGIVVCGLGSDGVGYVLADCSVRGMRPEGWARAVARAAEAWEADRVIAEKNQGGDMVEGVLLAADLSLPVRLVSASRGKSARAEPVASWMESGKVRLAGRFPELEDELAGLQAGGGYDPGSGSGTGGPGRSPDRADACVWALSALMRKPGEPRVAAL
jgi:phage terminase large subunit-like protein